MAMAQRSFSQIPTQFPMYRTIIDTVWLYPDSDIQTALKNTTYPYQTDGFNIICPTIADFTGLYLDIYNQTTITQPVGNTGFTLGVGTLLHDMGKTIEFKLPSGAVILRWRLVKQLTPQSPATVIPTPGNSPNGTIGFVTIFTSYGPASDINVNLDMALVVRV